MATPLLTREQLQERLLALHQASLELVRDVSLDSLLQRIAELAREMAQARYAAVGVLDINGQLEAFIPVGMTGEEISLMAHPPVGLGLIGALMRAERPIRLDRISDDARSTGFPLHHPPMSSFLGVPIRMGERALGQIYLTDKEDGGVFSEDDERIIEMMAAYAAVAIANARQYKELVQRDQVLTRRNENLALLNQLATTLASSSDVDLILNKALTQVMDYLHLEIGEVFLRQEESKVLRLVLHRGSYPELWLPREFALGEGIIGSVARSGQPRLMTVTNAIGRDFNRALLTGCIHQIAVFPLNGRQGLAGVLCVATCHPEPLDELEMQFLQAISAWVATAIENANFSLQGRRLAVLEERERIGMDLHDGIIQSIYAVGLTLEHARLLMDEEPAQAHKSIHQAIDDLNHTIRDIRAYILDLRPRQLHDESLMEGLKRLVNEFRANTLVEVSLQGPADGLTRLPDAPAIALFHICQEALANVAKHAHARRVEVSVWTTPDRVLMEVSDDGRGFNMEKVRLSIGHGLLNMQTRVRNVGGDVEITSEEGAGTSVLVLVPFSDDE